MLQPFFIDILEKSSGMLLFTTSVSISIVSLPIIAVILAE